MHDLIARLESCRGPDREVDIAISALLGRPRTTHRGVPVACDSAGVEVPRFTTAVKIIPRYALRPTRVCRFERVHSQTQAHSPSS